MFESLTNLILTSTVARLTTTTDRGCPRRRKTVLSRRSRVGLTRVVFVSGGLGSTTSAGALTPMLGARML